MSTDINSIQSMYSTNSISGVTSSGSSATGTVGSSVSGAFSVDVSQPGQLFSQLQSLAQSDPTQFKQVTAEIASQLKDAASSATGKQADFLNNLANRFQTASQSGKASDLAPPTQQGGAQASGHHHHHHHAEAASSSQASSTSQSSQDSVWQTVQNIIANALGSTSTD